MNSIFTTLIFYQNAQPMAEAKIHFPNLDYTIEVFVDK